LQTYVFHLRQALEPDRSRGGAGGVLVTRGRGYLLRVDRGHHLRVPVRLRHNGRLRSTPQGANFYPYFTMTSKQPLGSPVSLPAGACVWNFGNTIQGITTADFGQDAQYGAADVEQPGTSISAPTANPEFNGSCPAFSQP
jgi:hypothetical protein